MNRLLSKTKLVHYLLAGYAILLFCSQLVFLITNCKIQLHGNCDAVAEIVCNYHISDWLINYEGGFVRRGLMGEFLYWIYNLTHVNIPILITVSSFCLLLLFQYCLHENGVSIGFLLYCCHRLSYLEDFGGVIVLCGFGEMSSYSCLYGLHLFVMAICLKTRKYMCFCFRLLQ